MNLSNSLTVPIEFEKEVDTILASKSIEVKKKDHMANSAHWPACEESEDTKNAPLCTVSDNGECNFCRMGYKRGMGG